MKIRLVFDLDDRQRRALGRALRHRRAASRTEAVQFIQGTISAELATLVERLAADGVDDPDQLKLFGKPQPAARAVNP